MERDRVKAQEMNYNYIIATELPINMAPERWGSGPIIGFLDCTVKQSNELRSIYGRENNNQ